MVQQGSGLTSCSQKTKGTKAPRTSVFIHYLRGGVSAHEYRAVSVSGNGNGDYGGLIRRTKLARTKTGTGRGQ